MGLGRKILSKMGFGKKKKASKKVPEGWEECSFKCKAIPPLKDSRAKSITLPASKLEENLSDMRKIGTFRLMVWNIYKNRNKGWSEDYGEHSSHSDFVMLQEAVIGGKFDSDLSRHHNWDMGVSFLQKDDTNTGVLTASKIDPSTSFFLRAKHREPFGNTPKMILGTEYVLPNTEKLLLLNIHGINFRGLKGLKSQLEVTKSHINTHVGPIIFAGDFNTKNKKRRKYLYEFMEYLNFKEVRWSAGSSGELDYVFYKGLEVSGYPRALDLPSSDHPLLIADFKFTKLHR